MDHIEDFGQERLSKCFPLLGPPFPGSPVDPARDIVHAPPIDDDLSANPKLLPNVGIRHSESFEPGYFGCFQLDSSFHERYPGVINLSKHLYQK
jgi:hypothetical protein